MDQLTMDVIDKVSKGARGRKDAQGDEAVLKVKPLKESWANLYAMKVKLEAQKDKYNDAKKAVAEKSGFQSAVINKAINAQFKEKIEEAKRDVDQLSIVLNEVAESVIVENDLAGDKD